MWQIVISGPGYFDTPYDLPEGSTALGRADENDIVLSGDLVSRRHARIHVRAEQCTLEDLNSRNGTMVNGESRTGISPLKIGDSISVGENTLSIRQPGGVETAQTELVDPAAQGIQRIDGVLDLGPAVLISKDIKDRSVLNALDNVLPFEPGDGFFSSTTKTPPPQPQVSYPSLLLLYKTAQLLSTAPSLKFFLDQTLERVMQWVAATTAVVLLRQSAGAMSPAAMFHRGSLAQGEVPVSAAIVGAALGQGAALAVADVRDDVRFANRDSVILYGVGRVLCIPIGEKAPFRGVLYLNMPAGEGSQLESVLDLCTAVANLIDTAVEKFTLKEQTPSEALLRKSLGRSFPPGVADRRLEAMSTGHALAWETRALTALRVELAQPNSVWELGPQIAGSLVAELTQRLSAVIFSFEGTVIDRTGDGLTAVFGAPEMHDDHAVRAVRAALSLRLEWGRQVARNPTWGAVPLRVGVATGRALMGDIGPGNVSELCVVGESTALAGPLAASATSGQVLITGKTLASIGARFEVTPLGPRALNPGLERVPAFEVVEEDVLQNTEPGH